MLAALGPWEPALAAACSATFSIAAWRRRSLSRSGCIAASAVGFAVWAGAGFGGFVVLAAFFLTSTLLGRVGKRQKAGIKREFDKGDRRDAFQVLANGGVAAGCAAAAWLASPGFAAPLTSPAAAFWLLAAMASLGSACADTWATELGVLSPSAPRSILTLRPAAPGTSGAVSPLGLAVALAGATCIAALATACLSWPAAWGSPLVVLAFGGWFGAAFDSVLGASVQRQFRCSVCGRRVEVRKHCSASAEPDARRWAVLNNDAVNLLANGSAAMLVAVLQCLRV